MVVQIVIPKTRLFWGLLFVVRVRLENVFPQRHKKEPVYKFAGQVRLGSALQEHSATQPQRVSQQMDVPSDWTRRPAAFGENKMFSPFELFDAGLQHAMRYLELDCSTN